MPLGQCSTSMASFSGVVFSSVSFWASVWLGCCSSWSVCILLCWEETIMWSCFLVSTHGYKFRFICCSMSKENIWQKVIQRNVIFHLCTSPSLSPACSISMGSSASSHFCTSTREALDTLKMPWMFTRTLTLTLELSPDACGTTFWIRNWPRD